MSKQGEEKETLPDEGKPESSTQEAEQKDSNNDPVHQVTKECA